MRITSTLAIIVAAALLGLWPPVAGADPADSAAPAAVQAAPAPADAGAATDDAAAGGAASSPPEPAPAAASEPAAAVPESDPKPAGDEDPKKDADKKADAKSGADKKDADKKDAAEKAKPKTPEEQAEELFTKGRDALLKSQFDEAIKLLGQAVKLDKTKTSYRLNLARAYRFAGKVDEAARQLEEILKTTPDHVEAGQDLAEIYAAAERWQDVVGVLEPLLKYRHDYPTYHMLAEAQYSLGKHDKAREYYEEAIKLNPQSPTDHYQLGNIYLAANRFARAADAYQAALRLGLDGPVLRYKLGSAFFNLRNYFGQISVRTIKSGSPGTIHESWYLIEEVPGREDTFRCAPEASAIYQIARAMADGIEDRPDIHVLKATIYLNARRYPQAYDLFTEILPTVKEDKALFYYYYAQAALGSGRFDRYLELLDEAIKLDPEVYESTRVDAYLAVADHYNQLGRLDQYIEYLAKAVDQSPQTASLHLKLGNAYEETKKFDQAIVQWRMVLDLEPEHPQRLKLLNLIEKYQKAAEPAESPAPEALAPA